MLAQTVCAHRGSVRTYCTARRSLVYVKVGFSGSQHPRAEAGRWNNRRTTGKTHAAVRQHRRTEPFSLSLQDLANLLPASSPAKAALNGLGDIAQVGASGSVTAEVSADLELDLGIRLTTDPNDVTRGPFTPFIYDSSHISLTAQLDATNLNANVNLGPIGLFIVNGSAHLTKETNPSLVESPAEIGLTLPTIAGHRYYFDQAAGAAQPVLQGQMSLDLPLAAPLISNSIGDLTAFADLSNIAGTINVTAPDLADAIGNFNLLSNLGVIVDGLDSLLGVVSDGLDDLAFVKELPLVGDHLQDAFTFIDDLRSTLRNTLEPLIQNPGGNAITEAQKLIAQALGNSLSDTNGDGSLLQDLTGGGNIDPNSVSDTGTSANFSFIKDLITVDQLANEVPTQGSGAFINLGSFSLAGDDLRNPDSDVSQLTNFASTQIDDVGGQLAGLANDGNSDDASDASFLGDAGNLDGTNTGFDFPLFDDPTQAFRLLLGQDVSLVTFTPPQLNFNKNFSFSFSPFWPLSLTFGGDLSGTSNIEFGYDTNGSRQFLSDQDPLDLLDGFYASSSGTENGTALPELSLHMDMYVSGGLDAEVASLVAKGQLNVDVDASLNDPNHDGKVHADEMAYELKNQSDLGDKILSIVDITGSVSWSMDIEASVGPISKSFTVASGTILNFDTNQVLEGTTLWATSALKATPPTSLTATK